MDTIFGIEFSLEPGERLVPAVLGVGLPLGRLNGIMSSRLPCGFPGSSRTGRGRDRSGEGSFGLGGALRNCINNRFNGDNRGAYCVWVEGGRVEAERVGLRALVPNYTIDGEYAD